ncbi:NRT1/ PTR FAMILY 3.1-like protein [Drosera capensis]
MEKMEEQALHSKRRQKGGLITMPFIFATEACEKLAVVGFQANMISYLTQQLHMPLTKAANTLSNFGGTASLTPLIGAFIADAHVGKFWTLTMASLIYQIVRYGELDHISNSASAETTTMSRKPAVPTSHHQPTGYPLHLPPAHGIGGRRDPTLWWHSGQSSSMSRIQSKRRKPGVTSNGTTLSWEHPSSWL